MLPTRALAESLGVHVNRSGEALCPFHQDTNRSLRIYKDASKGWVCFGCHKGGSVIDFAMEWYGITFRQAVVRLDSDFGLGLPLTHKPTAEERRKQRQERERLEKEKEKAEHAFFQAKTSEKNASMALCECLSTIESERPKRPENGISDEYAEALWMLPILRDKYAYALYEFEITREEVERLGTTA